MSRRPVRLGPILVLLLLPAVAWGQDLQEAIQAGNVEQVASLLEGGADPNAAGPQGLTAVDLALWMDCQRDSELLGVLLEGGGRLEPDAPWGLPLSRLHLAATFGNARIGRLLLEAGADPNQQGRRNETALLMAARGGHLELARVLLDHGARVGLPDAQGKPPLTWAVERGHAPMVDLLLQRGSDVEEDILHLAALGGHVEIVRRLVERGVPVDLVDEAGHTPLYYAARYGHRRVADILLEKGADAPVPGDTRFGPSPYLTHGVGEGEAVLWYLNNRGWAVKTHAHLLVFDQEEFGVTRPTEPSLANGFLTPAEVGEEDVVAFYTCYHGEIGESAYIHQMEDSLRSVLYVQNEGDPWRGSERSIYLSPRGAAEIPGGRVTTIGTMTQMATLGHLVEVDDMVLYYQGFRPDDMEYYEGELDFLEGVADHIDIAFLPVPDPDSDPEGSGFKLFLDRFHPRAVALLDPNRREEMYPGTAELVEGWGGAPEVYAARFPGDVFFYKWGGGEE